MTTQKIDNKVRRVRKISQTCTNAYPTKNLTFNKENPEENLISVKLHDVKFQGKFDGEIEELKTQYWLVLLFHNMIVFSPNKQFTDIKYLQWFPVL